MRGKTGLSVLLCLLAGAAWAEPTADQVKLAAANTDFAFDLLKQIVRAQPESNVFISPFSVSTALLMTGNGAAGETKAEMQRTLRTAGLAPEALNAACRDLSQSLNARSDVILDLANAIWYQRDVRLKPEFVSVNREYFQAELDGLDFTKPAAAYAINHWAETNTRGKIKNIVRWPLDRGLRLILANAIYFKGKWDRPFNPGATKLRTFHLAGGGEKPVPTMWHQGNFIYQESDGFQAVRLPYSGGHLQMYLFLPSTNSDPAKLLAGFDGSGWRDKILPQFQKQAGTLALPRFKIEYGVLLNDPLKALGLRRAFADADFSAMTNEKLSISEVKQNSFVEVNEEGTEAAAVTGVHVTMLAGIREPVKPFEMIVDRPFLFVIGDDQTKSLLFMGLVYDPAGQ